MTGRKSVFELPDLPRERLRNGVTILGNMLLDDRNRLVGTFRHKEWKPDPPAEPYPMCDRPYYRNGKTVKAWNCRVRLKRWKDDPRVRLHAARGVYLNLAPLDPSGQQLPTSLKGYLAPKRFERLLRNLVLT